VYWLVIFFFLSLRSSRPSRFDGIVFLRDVCNQKLHPFQVAQICWRFLGFCDIRRAAGPSFSFLGRIARFPLFDQRQTTPTQNKVFATVLLLRSSFFSLVISLFLSARALAFCQFYRAEIPVFGPTRNNVRRPLRWTNFRLVPPFFFARVFSATGVFSPFFPPHFS